MKLKEKEMMIMVKELTEEEFKKLDKPSYDLEKEKDEIKEKLREAYFNIIDLLKQYCDLKNEDYPLIASWIIGTYLHSEFISYPFLFLNAVKGSGKTRTLKIITKLSKDGEIMISPTEAVLFRTKGTLGIDEGEGLGKKNKNRSSVDNVRELLNASYKKGSKVKRMKQKKGLEGTEQVVEEFDVYRPIVMANIEGMEDVLSDRCITIILEKSNKKEIVNLIEIYEYDELFLKTKEILIRCTEQCSLCSVVSPLEVYREWNSYITTQTTLNKSKNKNLHIENYTKDYTKNYIKTTQKKETTFFETIKNLNINGRDLEITLPLMIIANQIGKDVLNCVVSSVKFYVDIRREDQYNENQDVLLLDFVTQYPDTDYQSVKTLTKQFNDFAQYDFPITSKSFGWALKRLNIILDKKRVGGGNMIRLNIEKAQKKLEVYK